MKRNTLAAVCLALAGAVTMQSCIGSFCLFRGLLSWNKKASKKFVNEILYILLSPAYLVCGVVDAVVLNTVEFWTGKNPAAGRNSRMVEVRGQDGRLYAVRQTADGYDITRPDGTTVRFRHNEADDSWAMEQDGQTRQLFRYNGDGTLRAILPNGTAMDITMNDAGLGQLRQATGEGVWMAWNK